MTEKKSGLPPEKFTAYEKWVIALLALTQFTVILDFMVMSPMGDILMKVFQISPRQFGYVVSSYAFSAGLSGILTAGFADGFDRKKILVFFYSGFILGTLFCALANNYETLLIARIVTGLFGGVIGSISMAIVTDVFGPGKRGRVIGFVQMGFSVSQVLGIPAGIYFANNWGWQSAFFMIVGLGAIAMIAINIKLQPIDGHLQTKRDYDFFQHFQKVVSDKKHLVAFSATAFLTIGGYLLMPFASSYAVNNLKVAPENLPLLFLFTGISSLIIMPIVGNLADRVNKFTVFTVGSVWAAVFIAIYSNQGPIPLWLVISINVLLYAGVVTRITSAFAMTSAVPKPEDRGAFNSINSSVQQTAGGIASVCAGMIVYQKNSYAPLENYDVLGYITIVIIAFCIFLMYRVSKITEGK